ncbi:MAG: hypothetical protein EHM20_01015 [Alphaproteobacteria bacterium]|nr:MAG: hypothetical protein EHM20_01015 [Alphaproteobacteria bacterium]
MATQILVTEKKYEGKYVAFRSFNDSEVIASGNDPLEVLQLAQTARAHEPVIVFIPENHGTCIY